LLARELDRGHDIGGIDAACDKRRAAVDHPVVNLARGVVLRIAGLDQLAAKAGPKCLDGLCVDHGGAPLAIR
jgi:hypothetical protein